MKAKFMGIDMERFQLHYQVGSWGLRGGSCPRNGAVVLWGSLPLPRFPPPVVMSTPPAGPAAAAVRGRSRHEDVRQSQSQRQPAHLPPQQEVLQEVTGEGGDRGHWGRCKPARAPLFCVHAACFCSCSKRPRTGGTEGLGTPKSHLCAPRSPARAEAAAAVALQRSFLKKINLDLGDAERCRGRSVPVSLTAGCLRTLRSSGH